MAPDALRVGVHRAGHPADLPQFLHRPARLSVGHPAGQEPLDGVDDRSRSVRFLIRDRDSKFSSSFDEVFRSGGTRVIVTPIRAPNANAYAERVIGTLRSECL